MRKSLAVSTLLPERERWFLWSPPLFAVGVAIYFALPVEPGWPASVLPVLLAFALRALWRKLAVAVALLNAACLMAAGFATAKTRTEWVRAPVLVQPLRHAVVTGRIWRVEERADQSRRITLKVVAIDGLPPQRTPARVRIRLKTTEPGLELGALVRVRARLAAPARPALPNGYDFARAAYYQGIGAVGFAVSAPDILNSPPPRSWHLRWHVALQTFRTSIGDRIEAALPGEVGAMANALMTGERSGISQATNDLYRDAGIFHILSISGLHMAIMGGAVFIALRFGLAAIPRLALNYPIKKWAAVAAAIAAFGYLLISGGAHPTVRSFVMILIMLVAIVLDRPAIALRNVALAALVILAVLPESLFNAGFQLSFAAVVALVSAYETHQERARRRDRRGFIQPSRTPLMRAWHGVWLFMIGTVATTVIAGLATAPFAAFHFHATQQYAVLTNMLAIPLSNLLVMPAALAAFIAMPMGLEATPLWVMGGGITAMTWSAHQIATLPGAVVAIPAFPERALQLMTLGGLWFCIWRSARRWLGVIVTALGIYVATQGQRPDALIGKQGELVAIRDSGGRLAAMQARRARYEFTRWLEADGDTRKPAQAWTRQPFRCDLAGCTARVGPHLLMLPRSPSALIDDCTRPGILVLSFPQPKGCRSPAKVLDYRALRRSGTHALYVEQNASLRLETVENQRGHRPWTEAAHAAARTAQRHEAHRSTRDQRGQTRTNNTRSPEKITSPRYRPEIEDDGHPLYWWR